MQRMSIRIIHTCSFVLHCAVPSYYPQHDERIPRLRCGHGMTEERCIVVKARWEVFLGVMAWREMASVLCVYRHATGRYPVALFRIIV